MFHKTDFQTLRQWEVRQIQTLQDDNNLYNVWLITANNAETWLYFRISHMFIFCIIADFIDTFGTCIFQYMLHKNVWIVLSAVYVFYIQRLHQPSIACRPDAISAEQTDDNLWSWVWAIRWMLKKLPPKLFKHIPEHSNDFQKKLARRKTKEGKLNTHDPQKKQKSFYGTLWERHHGRLSIDTSSIFFNRKNILLKKKKFKKNLNV